MGCSILPHDARASADQWEWRGRAVLSKLVCTCGHCMLQGSTWLQKGFRKVFVEGLVLAVSWRTGAQLKASVGTCKDLVRQAACDFLTRPGLSVLHLRHEYPSFGGRHALSQKWWDL